MTTNLYKNINIDAVILWVDGNDLSYKSKINPFLKNKAKIKKSYKSRYTQINEIKYTVKSILKYASFIDTIYIITDNQIPNFLKKNDNTFQKVKIIDHSIIFKDLEAYLPVFNSRTIESCIHRIPNLSEHFIYLNDDFFIINPTTKNDFFTEEGFPVLRGKWQGFDKKKYYKKKKNKLRAGHKTAQEKAAKIIGFNKLYRFKHTPHPIRKSTLINFFEANPQILTKNIKYKFRDKAQFLPVAIANHLEIKNKTCHTQKRLQLLYFRSYKKPLFWYKIKLKFGSNKNLFMALQSLNKSSTNKLNYIVDWMEKRLLN